MTTPERTLLRELVAYVDSPGFADSHTDVVNWLADFAVEARVVLEEAEHGDEPSEG